MEWATQLNMWVAPKHAPKLPAIFYSCYSLWFWALRASQDEHLTGQTLGLHSILQDDKALLQSQDHHRVPSEFRSGEGGVAWHESRSLPSWTACGISLHLLFKLFLTKANNSVTLQLEEAVCSSLPTLLLLTHPPTLLQILFALLLIRFNSTFWLCLELCFLSASAAVHNYFLKPMVS